MKRQKEGQRTFKRADLDAHGGRHAGQTFPIARGEL